MTTHQNRTVAANDGLITLYARREPALIRDPLLGSMAQLSLSQTLRISHVVIYRDPTAQPSNNPHHAQLLDVATGMVDDTTCSSISDIEAACRKRQWLQTP
ncbi:MAG: hypothetical protein ACK53F_10355 [Betaproteobacteria bacterium]